MTPVAPQAPAEPSLKVASLSLAAAKSKASKAEDEDIVEQAEEPAQAQAAAPPAAIEDAPQDEGKSDESEVDEAAGSSGVNPLLIAAGGLVGLGLIGAAVAGGGGGDEQDEPAPPANRPPVAAADATSATEGAAIISGSVATNDSDPDGNSLSFALAAPVAGLVLNSDGSYSFDPSHPAYNDLDTGETRAVVANYTVSDGRGATVSSTLTITVAGANDVPVAAADSFSTNEDTALVIAAPGVLGNDGDADGDALTAVLVAGPANGTLALGADGSFTYTPNANYTGADSFTYRPNDGSANGAPVTVSLTVTAVNDVPVGTADSYATNEDVALVIPATGVLANDGDADGDALTAVLVTGPANGTLALNADGSFTYTPNANYTGADSFTYRPNDGTANGAPVTVSLTVTAVNDVPVAVGESYGATEDVALVVPAFTGVLANDSDVDGNPLTAVLVSGVSNGTLALNSDGSFNYVGNANYSGTDSFTYKVNDGTVDGNTVTVNLTVAAANDAPVANDDLGTASEDNVLTVNATSGLLANDTDVDAGAILSLSAVNGAAGNVGSQITLASGALLTVNGDGSYSYNPNGQFEGLRPGQTDTDSFTYSTTDGSLTDTATVTITINGANEAPVAGDDSIAMTGNTPITITAAQLLGNDSDPDGLASGLTILNVTAGSHGTISDNGNGTYTFVPETGYQGIAVFNYTVMDTDGATDTGTVTATITGQVWYVDNMYGGENGASDGSYLKPFTSLAQLNDAGTGAVGTVGPNDGIMGDDDVDGAGDTIFVYNNGSAYNAGITLEASQTLLGDGQAFTVNGHNIGGAERTGGADVLTNSVINNAGLNGGITLSTDNTIKGLTVNGTATGAIGIQDGNGSVSNLVIDNVSLTGTGKAIDVDQGGTLNVDLDQLSSTSSTTEGVHLQGVTGTFSAATGTIQTSAGTGVLIGAAGGGTASSGGNVNFTYGGAISSPGGSLVEIQDRTGGTVNFSGALTEGNITSGQTGILIDQNGGTVNFTGQMFISSGGSAGTGVSITNSAAGTVNINAAGTGLDITTANGTGFNWVDGGTLNIQGSANSISASSGRLFIGQNGIIGTNGVTFGSMTSNGNVLTGPAILLSNVDRNVTGTFNVGNVTFQQAITSDALQISNGSSANATFGNFATQGIGAGNDAIEVSSSSGTYNFTGNVTLNTGAGNGITLANNTAGTTFSGGNLNIDTTSGTGINATSSTVGAASLSITGANNSVAATTGRAIIVDGVTSNLTLHDVSVSAGGATTGVYLRNTGATGQFVVTGSGGNTQDGSGGTITSGLNGITLVNASNISLNQMNILSNGDDGISGSAVTNFTINGSRISNNGNAQNDNGIDFGDSSVAPNSAFGGIFTVSNSTLQGNATNNLYLASNAGNLLVNLTGNSILLNSITNGNDGALIQSYGTANITANVTGNTFTGHRGDHFQAANAENGSVHLTFANNTLVGGHASPLGQGITIGGSSISAGRFDYNIDNNTINGAIGSAITVSGSGAAGSVYNGSITNNDIGTAGSALSGSTQGSGIYIGTSATTTHTVAVTNNIIREVYDTGINVNAGDAATSTVLNLTIQSNTIETANHAFSRNAIYINSGTTSTNIYGYADALTMRLNIGGAGALANNLIAYNGLDDIRLRHRIDTRIELLGYGGAPNDLAAVTAYLNGRNPGATSIASGGVPFAGGRADDGIYGTGSVPLPTAFLLASAPADEGQEAATLTQAELDRLVDAAIGRWADAGASDEQIAAMRATEFGLADLNGLKLAASDDGVILVDGDAAGHGWFVDATPNEDSEFAGGVAAVEGSYDLLTVLMHELGHQIGLEDSFGADDQGGLMFGVLDAGIRVLPGMMGDSALPEDPTAQAMGWRVAELTDLDNGGGSVDELLSALDLAGDSAGESSFTAEPMDLSFAVDPSVGATSTYHLPFVIDERVL